MATNRHLNSRASAWGGSALLGSAISPPQNCRENSPISPGEPLDPAGINLGGLIPAVTTARQHGPSAQCIQSFQKGKNSLHGCV